LAKFVTTDKPELRNASCSIDDLIAFYL